MIPTISPNSRAVVPDTVLVRILGDESVLLNLDSESYFGLDAVGTRMWSAVAEARSLTAALDRLAEEYDAEPEQLRGDLAKLVGELADAGLLRIVDV